MIVQGNAAVASSGRGWEVTAMSWLFGEDFGTSKHQPVQRDFCRCPRCKETGKVMFGLFNENTPIHCCPVCNELFCKKCCEKGWFGGVYCPSCSAQVDETYDKVGA